MLPLQSRIHGASSPSLSRRITDFLKFLRTPRGMQTIAFIALVALLLYLTSALFRLNPRSPLVLPIENPTTTSQTDVEKPTPIGTIDEPDVMKKAEVARLEKILEEYEPKDGVAFGIPVGGRTQRSVQLASIINNLLTGGAPASNIFVFEDVEGRPGKVNDPTIARVCKEKGVRVVSSHVSRADMPEDGTNFGIHLARHYKFMLDYLLVSPEAAGAVGADLDHAGHKYPFDFAVYIEDDLDLAPDFVKFFWSMSRVMKIDPTLYCVSAHQDNAFYGTSYEPSASSNIKSLSKLGFDFRRGNHFMAPGWMTSSEIYQTVVRDMWLDKDGQYSHKKQLHLLNGHWDRFFDSLTGKRDCIFPEIPRISHQGADGFTVDQRAQMELYSNIRLSKLPVSVDYGDLWRLTRDGYISAQREFIQSATRLISLEEIRNYRQSQLVYILDVSSDKDEKWNSILNGFFGLIGVGGYGGWEGYVKVRGIFNGAVYVRWITNTVMIVGKYSPYAQSVLQMTPKENEKQFEMISGGCYRDDSQNRDFSYFVPYFSPATLTPRACLSSCIYLGYKYAGLQAGMECWCGEKYGSHGKVEVDERSQCDATCGEGLKAIAAPGATISAASQSSSPTACGGAWKNNVYWHADDTLHKQVMTAPEDVEYVVGKPSESCTEACARESTEQGKQMTCEESLFPLLHRTCPLLQALIGCSHCAEEGDINRGIYSPGGLTNGKCTLSKGRYIKCQAKPNQSGDEEYKRACVCQVTEKAVPPPLAV